MSHRLSFITNVFTRIGFLGSFSFSVCCFKPGHWKCVFYWNITKGLFIIVISMCAICWKCFLNVHFFLECCVCVCVHFTSIFESHWQFYANVTQKHIIFMYLGVCVFFFSSCRRHLCSRNQNHLTCSSIRRMLSTKFWNGFGSLSYIAWLLLLFVVWNCKRNVSHLYSTLLSYKPLSLLYSH